MISPGLDAFLIAFLIGFVLDFTRDHVFGNEEHGQRIPRPIFAITMIVANMLLFILGPGWYSGQFSGPSGGLGYLLIGATLVYFMTHRSDVVGPSSKRHVIATLLGGFLVYLGGYGVTYLGLPGMGSLSLPPLLGILLTLFWVFLIVSIFEILSLIPMAMTLVILGIAILEFIGDGVFQVRHSFPGTVVSGALLGTLIGTTLGELLLGRSRVPEKSDVLVAGFYAAFALLSMFLKSLAFTSIILPTALIVLLMVMLGFSSFEKSILLRSSPRE